MKYLLVSFSFFLLFSCKPKPEYPIPVWQPYDETTELEANKDHEVGRMQYKLIQSKYLDKNKIWAAVSADLKFFNPEDYERLKPMILEKDITEIQTSIGNGELNYEQLTLWYLYRIEAKFGYLTADAQPDSKRTGTRRPREPDLPSNDPTKGGV